MASVRSYLAEPAVDGAPGPGRRDLALVGVVTIIAVVEASVRRDADWVGLPPGWRVASVLVFVASIVPALLLRRRWPLPALLIAFGPNVVFGAIVAATEDVSGGLNTAIVVLIVPYALYRWGAGRDGAVGAGVMIVVAVVALLTDPTASGSNWIGGFVVLTIPVLLGLTMRYRATAREQAAAEIAAREREGLARELHDSVAHHVSAIAIQARAGRAVAATDPDRALAVLGVIEDAASRTLAEMRAIVMALRDGEGDGAELSPRRGLAELDQLVQHPPAGLPVTVTVDAALGEVPAAVGTTIYRIARESVTNSARHARDAHGVWIDVAGDDEIVRLVVRDDGAPVATADAGGTGYGIRGMTERASLIGGRIEAGPGADRGWVVTAELPRVHRDRPGGPP